MPDATRPAPSPNAWQEAFAALPMETPPSGGWQAMSARLDARRPRARLPLWLATAAALLLAVTLPWRLQWSGADAPGTAPDGTPAAAVASIDPLEALYAESARLESLLAVARDDRVASGNAAAFSGELEAQVASIDAALRQPGLTAAQQLALWRERVDSLRLLGTFESHQRWLAAQGDRYDAMLVAVD